MRRRAIARAAPLPVVSRAPISSPTFAELMNFKFLLLPVGIAAGSAFFSGCATSAGVQNPSGVPVTEMRPDERGFVGGTGPDATDLVNVTDKMARSILQTPQIVAAQTPPTIVLEPVVNNTRFPINKDAFLMRIRSQLNTKAMGRVDFLDRAMMKTLDRERELKRSGQVTASSDPNASEFAGADFFLTGQLDGSTTKTTAGISDYVLYTFRLTDARTSRIVWEGFAEIKKQGLEDASYR
jgi:PBP1b-binding outer membrane lipoprotein LpoB